MLNKNKKSDETQKTTTDILNIVFCQNLSPIVYLEKSYNDRLQMICSNNMQI